MKYAWIKPSFQQRMAYLFSKITNSVGKSTAVLSIFPITMGSTLKMKSPDRRVFRGGTNIIDWQFCYNVPRRDDGWMSVTKKGYIWQQKNWKNCDRCFKIFDGTIEWRVHKFREGADSLLLGDNEAPNTNKIDCEQWMSLFFCLEWVEMSLFFRTRVSHNLMLGFWPSKA